MHFPSALLSLMLLKSPFREAYADIVLKVWLPVMMQNCDDCHCFSPLKDIKFSYVKEIYIRMGLFRMSRQGILRGIEMINSFKSEKVNETYLEKRRSKRVAYRLRAESFSDRQRHEGFIENFSLQGILKVIPEVQLIDFVPGMRLEVSFQSPSGRKVILDCEIKWLRHSPSMPFGLKHFIGMEIFNPPHSYTEFVRSLYDTYGKDRD